MLNIDQQDHAQQQEIEELRSAVADLSHRLKVLADSSQESSDKNTIKSSSPIIINENMELQPMSSSFKKTLHVSYTFY
jgi:hypothetical protein